MAIFFVDDNFAINRNADEVAAARYHRRRWPTAMGGANQRQLCCRIAELVDLIAQAGGKWIFIGMESIDDVNLKDVAKSFNKPETYQGVLESLAQRNIYAITSFIFGMDNDTPGVAEQTLSKIRTWPPGLPVFGQLTPFPATPLYDRLLAAGRLERPKHWMDFRSVRDVPQAVEDDNHRSPRRGRPRLARFL